MLNHFVRFSLLINVLVNTIHLLNLIDILYSIIPIHEQMINYLYSHSVVILN
jgi:hypothetical protein